MLEYHKQELAIRKTIKFVIGNPKFLLGAENNQALSEAEQAVIYIDLRLATCTICCSILLLLNEILGDYYIRRI